MSLIRNLTLFFPPTFFVNGSVPKQKFNSPHWLCQAFELVFEEVQKF